MTDMTIVKVIPEEGGGYIAYPLDAPTIGAFGETPAEALTELETVMELWLGAIRDARMVLQDDPTHRKN